MKDTTEQLKNLLFVSIISADNDEYDEDTKQAILAKYSALKKLNGDHLNFSYTEWVDILSPIGNEQQIHRLADILKS